MQGMRLHATIKRKETWKMKWKSELKKRWKYVKTFFRKDKLRKKGYRRYLYERIFKYRNLWWFPHELRLRRNRKHNQRKQRLYGMKGSLKKKFGRDLLKRDGNKCHYCPKRLRLDSPDCTVEHVIPASKGGETALHNLVLACRKCNGEKDNGDYATFLNGKVGHYKLIGEALSAAGITSESFKKEVGPLPQSPSHVLPSETPAETPASPEATHQSQSSRTPSDPAPSNGTSPPRTQGPLPA